MKSLMRNVVVLLLCALVGLPGAGLARAQEDTPVVWAVLFYSPTCPHCEQVIQEDLPPLYEAYGPQLQIIGIDTLESEGWALYQTAVEQFSIPEERQGVPTLIVGDTVLVGSDEIPEAFPALIEQGLEAGGVALPDIPGLLELLALQSSTQSDTGPAMPEHEALSLGERFARDPAGNTLAVVVLAGMILSLGYVAVDGRQALRKEWWSSEPRLSTRDWLIPVLALAGLAVAGYLTYVETSQVQAICGPVGDCNTVQQSEYARLFGLVPIGVLGVVGYLGILAIWAWRRTRGDEHQSAIASLVLFSLAGIGTLFSIYLTFLEPFIIGASCVWCLSSAVIITALLLLTAQPGMQAAQLLLTQPPHRSYP